MISSGRRSPFRKEASIDRSIEISWNMPTGVSPRNHRRQWRDGAVLVSLSLNDRSRRMARWRGRNLG
jgi:hypothetical protein